MYNKKPAYLILKPVQEINLKDLRFFDITIQLRNIKTQDDWTGWSPPKTFQLLDVTGIKQQYSTSND